MPRSKTEMLQSTRVSEKKEGKCRKSQAEIKQQRVQKKLIN